MSLRTILLDELNVLAKKNDPGFATKIRAVMVDRNPATLDPDEHDPVATAALAWKEVAPRGREAFENCAEKLIDDLEQARIQNEATVCDWPFAFAMVRLLRMLPEGMPEESFKGRCVRKLSGLVAERQEFLVLVAGSKVKPDDFWTESFRLYLGWHALQPAWLETMWLNALRDKAWPLDQGARLFLEDAAIRHPSFVTVDRLTDFWRVAVNRNASVQEIKRWFYVVGASLEVSATGQEQLTKLHDDFGGYLQDRRHEERGLPWDHFVECMSALFRNEAKRKAILGCKSPERLPQTAKKAHEEIPLKYKSPTGSVTTDLLDCLKAAA
ncbi:hypothetical protein EI77_00619 [Prosthecobacter fusiformis]|uniref:Uncharacterized protein n=1 Tax=Prosthecobacter fusiformis TaxID=48464 RepID=A0A4R7SRJ9_9BACT|nr:hypothetical protein [Prosthecobacter fusiformis]TDU81315.1 hypothetical protein EI77_00619 [Prosthecobacter fusiformis]